jgi:hypothetical protein
MSLRAGTDSSRGASGPTQRASAGPREALSRQPPVQRAQPPLSPSPSKLTMPGARAEQVQAECLRPSGRKGGERCPTRRFMPLR